MKNNRLWHPATVRAHRDLTPTVREFEIRPEGGVQPWTVGSHLNVQVFVDGREDTRSYSLVGLPHGPGATEVYRIAVKRAAPGRGGSRYMWSLETGAELMIGEPNNHFELSFGAPEYLLVAGGLHGLYSLAAIVYFEQFADGLSTVALFTIMMDRCRPHAPGTDYSLQASLQVLATGIAALGGGLFTERFGYSTVFATAACLTLVSLGPAIASFRRV